MRQHRVSPVLIKATSIGLIFVIESSLVLKPSMNYARIAAFIRLYNSLSWGWDSKFIREAEKRQEYPVKEKLSPSWRSGINAPFPLRDFEYIFRSRDRFRNCHKLGLLNVQAG